ncbi:MAG: barstar family protein [Nitrospiraceae bacterium]
MPTRHRLQSLTPPWVYLLVLKPDQTAMARLRPPSDLTMKTLDGQACRTKDGLLREIARTLAFPDYFGENWDALEECLCDLSWVAGTGHLLVIERAEALLAGADKDYRTFISILRSASVYWAAEEAGRVSKPFHTVCVATEEGKSARRRWSLPLWKGR